MKKVLYVTTVSRTINAFLVPHIEMLINEDHKVDIACSIDKEIDKTLINKGVQVYEISFSRSPLDKKNILAYKQIKSLVRKNKYDIVHVHTPVASFITRMSLRNEDIQMIYTAHGFHFYKGAPLINWIFYYPLERIAAKWSDRIITINSEDLDRANTFKLRNNGSVSLMHGVGISSEEFKIENFDVRRYRKEMNIEDEDFVILIAAELNKNKNHIQIIKAMKLLKDKYPRIKILIAGDGSLDKYLKDKVKKYNLEKQIKFLGFRNDIRELTLSCDCSALMSIREGLGKCLLEGIINDKGLLATNTRGPRELIKNGENGFLVETNDYKGTAKAIEQLYIRKLENKSKINKTILWKYGIDSVLKEVLDINTRGVNK